MHDRESELSYNLRPPNCILCLEDQHPKVKLKVLVIVLAYCSPQGNQLELAFPGHELGKEGKFRNALRTQEQSMDGVRSNNVSRALHEVT